MYNKLTNIHLDELEEELSRMPEARIPRDSEHLDDQIERVKTSVTAIPLSRILAYQEIVLTFSNNQFLNKSEEEERFQIKPITRYIFNSDPIFEKESQLHQYLMHHIPDYQTKCTVSIPTAILAFSALNTAEGLEDEIPFQRIQVKPDSAKSTEDQAKDIGLTFNYAKGLLWRQEAIEALPIANTNVNETEIIFEFYDSPFEYDLQAQSRSLLVYACTKKLGK